VAYHLVASRVVFSSIELSTGYFRYEELLTNDVLQGRSTEECIREDYTSLNVNIAHYIILIYFKIMTFRVKVCHPNNV
jgi:hypothetical protein